MLKVLVTGATSFIGSQFVEDVLAFTNWQVLSLERWPPRPDKPRVKRFYHDLRAEVSAQLVNQLQDASYLIHFAADVSGLKSLVDPRLSVNSNVVGTYNVLELARKLNLGKFIYVSSGEVVGSVAYPDAAKEEAELRPSNPYAASKAAAEALVNSYRCTFYVPAVIVRSMNLFGPKQHLPRFVPTVMSRLVEGLPVSCHVDKHGRSGSRNWLHVAKFTRALLDLLGEGSIGETYHVVGPERSNFDIINLLARATGCPLRVENVVPGPSHDFRYCLQDIKLGLDFHGDFEETLTETARWYDANREFLR